MKLIYIMIFSIFLLGCSARGQLYKQASLPTEGIGQVYISREDSFFGSAADIKLFVDGELKAKLSNNGYTVLELPPGNYKLKQDWSLSFTDSDSNSIDLEIKNKETSYALVKMISCAGPMTGELCHKPKITIIEKNEVLPILTLNKYQPVLNERELRYESCWVGWHPLFKYWC
tara:strand:+ start:339 stop:857 length:519 start_codon:yes stop_codon:yes gene_type:complete